MVTKFIVMDSKINKELYLNMCAVVAGVVLYKKAIKPFIDKSEKEVKEEDPTLMVKRSELNALLGLQRLQTREITLTELEKKLEIKN
jgi:hypothetical protein